MTTLVDPTTLVADIATLRHRIAADGRPLSVTATASLTLLAAAADHLAAAAANGDLYDTPLARQHRAEWEAGYPTWEAGYDWRHLGRQAVPAS